MNRRNLLILSALTVSVAIVVLVIPDKKHAVYHANRGQVFGTYYAIQYECAEDLHDSIKAAFAAFDGSLSMFNKQSVLSRINTGEDSIVDAYFVDMYRTAEEINALSNGAFDITVAPLVNLWGFGFKNRSHVTNAQIDSILPHVGMDKISIHFQDAKEDFSAERVSTSQAYLVKSDPQVQLDGGAIAKGQSCDMIASLLARHACNNYLVDIGGEVVAIGMNADGRPWRIGITKPIDDSSGTKSEVQKVLHTTKIALATSGNYRNFYYDGDVKRAHTIDPRTGYPVQHNVLSATVSSSTCMRADALATACMVLGSEDALRMIESDTLSSCYLIVSEPSAEGDTSVLKTVTSSRWRE